MEEVDSYFETVEDSEYDAGSEMSDEYTESDNWDIHTRPLSHLSVFVTLLSVSVSVISPLTLSIHTILKYEKHFQKNV